MINGELHITIAEAARRLDVSRKVMYSLLRRNNVKSVRRPYHALGSRLYVSVAAIEALQARQDASR